MTASHRDYLRELIDREESAAADVAALDCLLDETVRTRERVERIQHTLDTEQVDRARHRATIEAARDEIEVRKAAVAAAERRLAGAEAGDDPDAVGPARTELTRARDTVASAQTSLERFDAAHEAFEGQVTAARQDEPLVQDDAERIAALLANRPRVAPAAGKVPSSGLGGVADWAVAARAALLVARSAAATERDAIIRQANELGSAALGSPLAASGPRAVLDRLQGRSVSS